MANPYRDRPAHCFWSTGVAAAAAEGVDPVVGVPFTLSRRDAVATAGSCFAQHIAQNLAARGFRYLVTETFEGKPGTTGESYGVFPARFGNLYTARQLLQLFDRAYGLRHPRAEAWPGRGGGLVDPFRPRIQAGGFPDLDALRADRARHLAAVRRMFEQCDVFVFTLGLTEAWVSPEDGSVFPLAPGVVAGDAAEAAAEFRNFGFAETLADLELFLERFRTVNPAARVMLTVSPVALVATYEERHVLVSTVASKSILRAAVDELCRRHPEVAYFPSYEIVTGPQAGGRFHAPDLREVTAEGVAHVMSVFARHYLDEAGTPASPATTRPAPPPAPLSEGDRARLAAVAAVICDEEAIVS